MTEQELREAGRRIELDDIQKAIQSSDRILKKLSSCGLQDLLIDTRLLVSLISDYWSGAYRHIPYWALGTIVVSLLYILNPLDLVPEFIPAPEPVDDAGVMKLCLKMVDQELRLYCIWKASRVR